VQDVTNASTLATAWSALGLSGSSPIKNTSDSGGHRVIDLNLNHGDADVTMTFNDTNVVVRSSSNLSSVTLRYSDGSEDAFDGINAKSKTVNKNANKTLIGVFAKTSKTGNGNGHYYAADGSGGAECVLDFFLAERHTTESNFRIDTSINLQAVPPTSISPLYD